MKFTRFVRQIFADDLLHLNQRIGMKLLCYSAWVLSALLLVVSVDALPDPPAVNPHTVTVELHSVSLDCLNLDSTAAYFHPHVRRLESSRDGGSHHPSDPILLTGRATDPSPPPPA
jgi:hypothetical protein